MARIWKWSVVVFLLIGLCRHQEEAMMTALMDTPFMVWDLLLNVLLAACLWFFKHYSKNRIHELFFNYFQTIVSCHLWTSHET